MAVIALEGCDASGKSTLAKELSDSLNMLVVQGSSFENAKQSNEDLFKHFIKVGSSRNLIVDRTIYSNRVYATLHKDYSILNKDQRKYIEKLMKKHTIVVYLKADADILKERLSKRGDDYIAAQEIPSILNEYEKAIQEAKNNGVTVLEFDTGKMTTSEIVIKILSLILTNGKTRV